jgi:hypothetical protein
MHGFRNERSAPVNVAKLPFFVANAPAHIFWSSDTWPTDKWLTQCLIDEVI